VQTFFFFQFSHGFLYDARSELGSGCRFAATTLMVVPVIVVVVVVVVVAVIVVVLVFTVVVLVPVIVVAERKATRWMLICWMIWPRGWMDGDTGIHQAGTLWTAQGDFFAASANQYSKLSGHPDEKQASNVFVLYFSFSSRYLP
jgi:hypothetical protein